jgi:hypothetical protein
MVGLFRVDDVERSATVATLLNPLAGHPAANALVTEAMAGELSSAKW